MAASEMYDFLTTIAADVNQTLSLTAQGEISEEGDFNQVIHSGDDNSEERITIASAPRFYATFAYNVLTESDMGTLFDLYFDSAKANGMGSSFKWTRGDGHTYVVRFASLFTRAGQHQSRFKAQEVRLRILGRISD